MTVAEKLVAELKERGQHISTAESCTGGMIAAAIVDVSGASFVFEEGYVTYSNRVKQKLLGVKTETLERFTVVSAETAAEMAVGTARATGSELTISVTGYAGPEDGEDGTPAGTVYIGVCYQNKVITRRYGLHGDRQQVRSQARDEALKLALCCMEDKIQ